MSARAWLDGSTVSVFTPFHECHFRWLLPAPVRTTPAVKIVISFQVVWAAALTAELLMRWFSDRNRVRVGEFGSMPMDVGRSRLCNNARSSIDGAGSRIRSKVRV